MGNLDQEMAARAARLVKEAEQAESDRRAAQQRWLDNERRNTEEAQRVARIGMELVDLLQRHNVESEPVWALQVVGRHVVRHESWRGAYNEEEDKKEYVQVGQGWRVYTDQGRGIDNLDYRYSTGLDDSGRVFEIGGQARVSLYDPSDKRLHPGLCVRVYHGSEQAERIIAGDIFRDGVASLISGQGPLVVEYNPSKM